jgi:hypothetical protein
MDEDGYLDSYWEDQNDYFWDDPDGNEYDSDDFDDGDDFPLSLEYPGEDMEDLEPPF